MPQFKNFSMQKKHMQESRQLIAIDTISLKEKAKEKCLKILSKIKNAEIKMQNFQKIDHQPYYHWCKNQFQDLQSKVLKIEDEILIIEEKIFQLQKKIIEEENDIFFSESTDQKDFFDSDSFGSEDKIGEWIKQNAWDEVKNKNAYREFCSAAYEEMTGSLKDDNPEYYKATFAFFFDQMQQASFDKKNEQKQEKKKENKQVKTEQEEKLLRSQKIKGIYRNLARQLHPDMNFGLTLQHQELWNDVVQAYENKDLEKLESLQTLFTIFESQNHISSTLESMLYLAEQLNLKLKNKEKTIRKFQKSNEWKFYSAVKSEQRLDQFRKKIQNDLKQYLSNAIKAKNEQKKTLKLLEILLKKKNGG
jgi:hypothetical protein